MIRHVAAALAASLFVGASGGCAIARDEASAIPIASLDSDDYSDLRALLPVLEGVRIVQIGENTHGAGEYFELKSRLVRFLHEEAGFDVIVFESSFYQCAVTDRAMAREDVETMTLLTGCVFGVWHTREVERLFDYIRATRETERPLRLAGYDVQPIGWNKRSRPDYLAAVVARLDPGYAETVAALDQGVIDAYELGGSERRAHYRENRDVLLAAYDDLIVWLEANRVALTEAGADPSDADIAIQTAWSAQQYLRQQTAATMTDYAEARDFGMAENLVALAERLYPDARIIVWAHNAHIRHNNQSIEPGDAEFIQARAAGHWLEQRYGDAMMTIGLYARSGTVVDNARAPADIPLPPPGSVESWPAAGEGPATLFLAPEGMDSRWDAPVPALYGGTTPVEMTLRQQYDAILLFETVSPPEFLYE